MYVNPSSITERALTSMPVLQLPYSLFVIHARETQCFRRSIKNRLPILFPCCRYIKQEAKTSHRCEDQTLAGWLKSAYIDVFTPRIAFRGYV